jgi:hypothetical protein
MTVGSVGEVDALAGWHGRAIVKLQSSMRRYGATPSELELLTVTVRTAGLDTVGYALHLPLAGSDQARLVEIEGWLDHLDPKQPLWLSHLQQPSYNTLRSRHPDRMFRLRMGTGLWHGDKSFLHLHADVLGVHRVLAGDRAGYQLNEVVADGHLVLVSAGSATVLHHWPEAQPVPLRPTPPPHARATAHAHVDGLRPARRPVSGRRRSVDVQRPLITTLVDEVEWV